mmetsp:Transcript_27308/g.38811  ORF Transcript_27308/g.38811 Transcript_27308/m.38811 type:complete len:325 (+) Transcript_27308:338-1312(+)
MNLENLYPYDSLILINKESAVVNIIESFLPHKRICSAIENIELPSSGMGMDIVSFANKFIAQHCPQEINEHLGEKIHQIIVNICSATSSISIESMKKLMGDHFQGKINSTKQDRSFYFSVEVLIKAAIVQYLSFTPSSIFDKLISVKELLKEYPTFVSEHINELELQYLLTFRNMMKIALEIIPGKCNKRLLLDLCSTLEGSGRIYSTGGTQSRSTKRRVLIYEHESHMKRVPRTPMSASVPTAAVNPHIFCECGSTIQKRTDWIHKKSKRHIAFTKKVESDNKRLQFLSAVHAVETNSESEGIINSHNILLDSEYCKTCRNDS